MQFACLCSGYNDDSELYGVSATSVVPVAPRINITELIRQSAIESGWERSLTGGGVLNAAQSSQALCGLSQEVDRSVRAKLRRRGDQDLGWDNPASLYVGSL